MTTQSHNEGGLWQWSDEIGNCHPYDAVVQDYIEKCFQQGVSIVDLQNEFPHLPYVLNFTSMFQTRKSTGRIRPIRRFPTSASPEFYESLGLWQWSDDLGNCHPYDAVVQDYIEKCFQQGVSIVDLQNEFPHLPYVLNVTSMIQTRKSTGRIRPIRRFPISAPPELKESSCLKDLLEGPKKETEKSDSTSSTSGLRRSSRKRRMYAKSAEITDNGKKQEVIPVAEGFSLTKTLSSLTESVLSVFTTKRRQPKSSVCVRKLSIPFFMPHPPYFPPEEIMPVQNVKLPNDISVCSSALSGSLSADEMLSLCSEFCTNFPKEDNCSICCERFEVSSVDDKENFVIALQKCNHFFHKQCLQAMYNSGLKNGFLQCPVCKTMYGTKTGNQPPGTMEYHSLPCFIPSYPDCNTIRIIYHIPPGIQTSEHPHPGERFTCRGFPRYCYLPDNEKGRQVLKLLVVAWERRLIFCIGTSATTGESDTVTWNEIHHKTEFGSNVTGHGYPDPSYLDNVLFELALQGVVPDPSIKDS